MKAGNVEQVQVSLAHAPDNQVARIVAMVDALPQRGAADALIAPLRPRLAQLQPDRPVGFIRLLFTPLNPVIASTAEWRQGGVGVPRAALASLGTAARTALFGAAVSRSGEQVRVDRGPALWRGAALVLDSLAMPADWSDRSGLTDADYRTVVGAAAAVLHEAAAIETVVSNRRTFDDDTVRAIFVRTRDRGTAALDTVAAVLLGRLPAPVRII